MPDKAIIAVVGATGQQGGGLVRAIQVDPSSPFRARALTRKPDSAAARALASLGAEVVAIDLDDGASVARAFRGATQLTTKLTTRKNLTSKPSLLTAAIRRKSEA